MFYAYVRRFNVMDTVEKILGTKHDLNSLASYIWDEQNHHQDYTHRLVTSEDI